MTACVQVLMEAEVIDGAEHHRSRKQAQMRQYSRTVQWMKVVLPVGALVLIGLIFLVGRDRFESTPAQQIINAAALTAGLKLENPRYAGVTSDGDPFVVTADSALPDGAMPDRVELDQPKAELRLGNGITLNVTSNAGEMYRVQERLNLDGDVVLVTSDGYRAEAPRVELDMAKRIAVLPDPVVATGPNGGIQADHLRIEQTGKGTREVTALFTGNVRVTFTPRQ